MNDDEWIDDIIKQKERKLISEFLKDLKEIVKDWYPAKLYIDKWEKEL